MEAAHRALEALGKLGIFPENPANRAKVLKRLEVFLWRFLFLRWYESHTYFSSVESSEVRELVLETGYTRNGVLQFFAERQDDRELEDTLVVGLSLMFAAMRRASQRGFSPKLANIFVLQRMMEQVIDEVGGLEDLLLAGRPP